MNVGQVMMLLRMMRLMRILRLVKLIKSVRPLYILVTAVVAACQGVMWVLILTLTVLYGMAIVTTRMVGHGLIFPPGHHIPHDATHPFRSVGESMFTLFRQMSSGLPDDEMAALDELMDQLPAAKFAFVFFMVTSSWTLLSILTAVVSENMISTTGMQEEELGIQTAEEDRALHVKKLMELFENVGSKGRGTLTTSELDEFLADEMQAR